MSRARYFHRQADLCVRMALSAAAYEERIRLLDAANGYRQKAAEAEVRVRVQCRGAQFNQSFERSIRPGQR
jgi:hypothetical protein